MGILVPWGQEGGFGGLGRSRLRLPGRCGRPLELQFFGLGHAPLNVVCLWACTGGHGGVVPGRGGEREPAQVRAEVTGPPLLLLLLLLFVLLPWVVLFEADVPGQAADRRHGLKLVDDIPRDEVDVVVAELDTDVADALPPQLVELGIVYPLDALRENTQRFQFQLFCVLLDC